MSRAVSKLKKSIIIGITAVTLLSCVCAKALPQSWFITGSFFSTEDDEVITVINDENEDVSFRFGLFDLIAHLFD